MIKIKKVILITILLISTLLFLTTVNATDNITSTLVDIDQNQIEISLNETSENVGQDNDNGENITDNVLSQNTNKENLQELQNETNAYETIEFETNNITIKIIFISTYSYWMLDQEISIYEDNIPMKNISFRDYNMYGYSGNELDENGNRILIFKYVKDLNLEYRNNISQLTAPLFINIYSNTIKLEKNIYIPLTDTNIFINNQATSNKTWNNSIKSMEKAIKLANDNDKIFLNNIYFIQDSETPIFIDKNITIIGNNTLFKLQGKNTLFKIAPNATVNFINVTFTNNAENIISNEGNLKLIKSTFKENNIGLITNTGNLEIENCIFQDINQYFLTPQTKKDGLITNNGTLTIKNTIFNSPVSCVSNNLIKAVIYNNGKICIDNSNFTNINCRLIYNNATLELSNVKIENITSTKLNLAYELTEQEIIGNHSSQLFNIKNDDKTTPDGGVIYNNNTLTINNTTFTNIKVPSRGTTVVYLSNGSGENRNYDYNLCGGVIFNNYILAINNTTFQTITGNNGGAIYNNNTLAINNTTFQTITGNNGGAIYNNNMLTINNTTFTTLIAKNGGGAIYNTGKITINSTNFNQISANGYSGGIIYNSGECIINNSLLSNGKNYWTEYTTDKYGNELGAMTGYGGGICNNGILSINNSTITQCYSAAGSAIFNNGTVTLTNSQILKNTAGNGIVLRLSYWGNGMYETVFKYNGVITNSENKKAKIENSIIKDNGVPMDTTGFFEYFGVIHNYGDMGIYSSVFDNNVPMPAGSVYGNKGGINIYNRGTLTAKYNYLINYKKHSNTYGFVYTRSGGKSNINYNYYCSDPHTNNIIFNSECNYYFIPSFEQDYYSLKLNETRDIILYLNLTDGNNVLSFNDWDRLSSFGLPTTITATINGTQINRTVILQNNATLNFNYTNIKGEYRLYANIGGWIIFTDIDVGKEYTNMNVNYNNITYNDGNNATFNINVTGDNNTPTGNISIVFNDKKYLLPLICGTCNFTAPIGDLKPGTYPIKIQYEGSKDHFKTGHIYQFKINKIPINITLNTTNIRIGETGKLTITVTPDTANMVGYLYIDGILNRKIIIESSRLLNLNNMGIGTHNITIKIKDDEYYIGGEANILFTVKLYETNLTLQSKDVMPGENATINITINPGDIRGNATISINGQNQSIFLSNTTTPITIHSLKNGTYYVTVYYHGDTKYAPSTATTTFKVLRNQANMTVNITSNEDLTGNILVKTNPEDCTGQVGVYINNDLKIMNLKNGTCNFTVKFKKGTNYIYVLYLGDNYYESISWNTTQYIFGKVFLKAENLTQQEHQTINYTVKLTDEEGNPYEYTNITVNFQNKNHTITTNEKGTATLPINTYSGIYIITATCQKTTITTQINITPTKMNIEIEDILAGENETITIQLPQDAKGNLTITIDNQTTYNKTLKNGSTTIQIPDLTLGKHTLEIQYTGDEKYTNQTVKTTFHIKNSLSTITIETKDNLTYGEKIQITATVTQNATGTVTFTIDGQTKTTQITGNKATATFENINTGNQQITAHYNGNSIYQGSTIIHTINIKKATPKIEIQTSELTLGKNIEIKAILTPKATGNITFTIPGLYSPREKPINDGNSTWIISPLNTGSYMLVAIYNGDDNNNPTTIEEILIINQTKTELTLTIPTINADEDLIVYATLTDENNQKITGNAILEINGNYYKITITNGQGSRNLGQFNSNTYLYTATYKGTETLSRAVDHGIIQVKANNYKISGNKNMTKYYGTTITYKIQIKNNNKPISKGEIVKITINKKTVYVKTTQNGYATIKMQLIPGTYTITTSYKNAKATNKITIKTTLITKNKSVKKAKKITYTAKLLNKNGKILKNKKITFKIKGKLYTAKTNKKGIAKIKIKNLKVGKYKIKTNYGKIINTNTIRIKK